MQANMIKIVEALEKELAVDDPLLDYKIGAMINTAGAFGKAKTPTRILWDYILIPVIKIVRYGVTQQLLLEIAKHLFLLSALVDEEIREERLWGDPEREDVKVFPVTQRKYAQAVRKSHLRRPLTVERLEKELSFMMKGQEHEQD
jgi:hypothetical protein